MCQDFKMSVRVRERRPLWLAVGCRVQALWVWGAGLANILAEINTNIIPQGS